MCDPKPSPLIQNLIELRSRLLFSVTVIFFIFIPLFYFGSDLYTLLAQPLIARLPEGSHLIATSVTSPLLTPLKLSLVLAVFVAVPLLLYQAWAFIAPGLFQKEKRLMPVLLFLSVLLFYCGMAFAYFVVFPLVFNFFVSVLPQQINMMPDIAQYLDFSLKLFFAFGLAFEVPIVTFLLIQTGIATVESLADKRPYVIVLAFVLGMFLTPPDVLSQVLLAIPIWVLFEAGLLMSRLLIKQES